MAEKDVCATRALDFGPVTIRLLTKPAAESAEAVALDKMIWMNISGQKSAGVIEA